MGFSLHMCSHHFVPYVRLAKPSSKTGITESLSNFLYLRVPLLQLLTNLLPELVLLLHRDGIPVVRHQDELQGLLVPIQRALSKNLATS